MRSLLGVVAAAVVLSLAHGARAQASGAVHGSQAQKSRGPMIFRFEKARNEAAVAARARAAAGDCKDALDFFDEALRHSIDPTLYRDRGVCHEKLGDVYPAIDDYREYLSQEPDAPDADEFRSRLQALEKDADRDIAMSHVGAGGSFAVEMAGGMTNGETPSNAVKEEESEEDQEGKAPPEDKGKPLKVIEHDEKRDAQAIKSPLRLGKGFVLGAYLYPRYVFNTYAFDFGQGVGVHVGYSLGATSTLLLEIGYMNQLSTGSASQLDGFTSAFGYELRLPFDTWADNQFILGAFGGYENMANGTLGQSYASFVVRGQAGYRHVFGPSFSLDFVAQGGLMGTFPINAPSGTSAFEPGGFVGGDVIVNVGF